MAADDVAQAVARVSVGTPVNGVLEVAGPEKFRLDELIRRYFRAIVNRVRLSPIRMRFIPERI